MAGWNAERGSFRMAFSLSRVRKDLYHSESDTRSQYFFISVSRFSIPLSPRAQRQRLSAPALMIRPPGCPMSGDLFSAAVGSKCAYFPV